MGTTRRSSGLGRPAAGRTPLAVLVALVGLTTVGTMTGVPGATGSLGHALATLIIPRR